jgi:hypothetical protein
MKYACDKCDFTCDTVPEIASHKRWQHPIRKTRKVVNTKHPDTKATKKAAKIAKAIKRPKQRQEKSQHIPRPENFDVSGCGIEMYYDHLTFIPDLDDSNLTVEYLDKERVCKKCRKRYKLDSVLAKHKRR